MKNSQRITGFAAIIYLSSFCVCGSVDAQQKQRPTTRRANQETPRKRDNESVVIRPQERDRALKKLPDISTFRDQPSDRFLVDLNQVRTGHPYLGKRAQRPHTGGHLYFQKRENKSTDVKSYPAIYAVADGVIERIDYHFRLREMYEPALKRRVANARYGIGLLFAKRDGHPIVMHYSIEPFIDPPSKEFYRLYLLVKPGQWVKKGDVIARMHVPDNQELATKSHIHFNLIGGRDHRFMAPAIFTARIARRFHATWGERGLRDEGNVPPCFGFRLDASENPFQPKAVDEL